MASASLCEQRGTKSVKVCVRSLYRTAPLVSVRSTVPSPPARSTYEVFASGNPRS